MRNKLGSAINRRVSGVRLTAEDERALLASVMERKDEIVKKKISVAMVAAAVLIFAAVACAFAAGMNATPTPTPLAPADDALLVTPEPTLVAPEPTPVPAFSESEWNDSASDGVVNMKMQYVSVEGYYCLGQCDAKNEQCQLTTSGELVECDPYDSANYACDGRDLTTCRLNSNLQGIVQNYRCAEACVTEGGVAMCGFACDRENDTSTHCVYADSVEYEDSGHFICKKFDNGTLYSIWNGEYDFCETGCTAQTGLCHD